MFKNILLATDGSAASQNACAMAVSLAQVHGATLTAVYVVDPYPYLGIGETNPMGFQAYMSSAFEHAAQAHAGVLALCEAAPRKVDLNVRTFENVTAVDGILQGAADAKAGLIVIGSHGRTGIIRLMLGSVASRVVAGAAVPVLVVPSGIAK